MAQLEPDLAGLAIDRQRLLEVFGVLPAVQVSTELLAGAIRPHNPQLAVFANALDALPAGGASRSPLHSTCGYSIDRQVLGSCHIAFQTLASSTDYKPPQVPQPLGAARSVRGRAAGAGVGARGSGGG